MNRKYKLQHLVTGIVEEASLVLEKARGTKSQPLDIFVLDTGYRILPYELKHFWKFVSIPQALIYHYARVNCKDLVFPDNPFLKIIK